MIYHHSKFSYNSETKTLTAELSDLGITYIPYGIQVEGKRRTVEFYLHSRDTDREGEVQGWRYQSDDGLKLLLIND